MQHVPFKFYNGIPKCIDMLTKNHRTRFLDFWNAREERRRERDWSDHSHHDNGHGGNQGVGLIIPAPQIPTLPFGWSENLDLKKAHIWQFQTKKLLTVFP